MSVYPNLISDAAFPRFPMGARAPFLASVVRSVNQATVERGLFWVPSEHLKEEVGGNISFELEVGMPPR